MKQTMRKERIEVQKPVSKLRNGLRNGLMVLGAAGVLTACGAKAVEHSGTVPAASTATLVRREPTERAAGDVQEQRETAERLIAAGESAGLRGTSALFVLSGGRVSGGQLQIGVERYRAEGQGMIRADANIVDSEGLEYNWLFYQNLGNGEQLLVNPREGEGSQPAYLGVVMRNVTLTDDRSGDFVVRVYANQARSVVAREFGPVVEPDGRVRPENVLYQLESGSLLPVRSTVDCSEVCITTSEPSASIRDRGETTPVMMARQVSE